ncbi:CAP10 domain-containing protein [Mycena venus]|uniref:CAP10 domain-containing protein n=1 Tax=Mycena venus TaxID=2733690 RepID=A0A8H6Y214_9AGAR|nr:CAP10 domain-containing protein [Mycena venus]
MGRWAVIKRGPGCIKLRWRCTRTYLSHCRPRRPRFYLALAGAICIIIIFGTFISQQFSPSRKRINVIFALQSRNLKEARSRYILKNNRRPPPSFDKWFSWARSNKCLIDDYDQIHRDFEPFYQMAETNSTHFRNMIQIGVDLISGNSRPGGLANITIKGGEVSVQNDRTYFDNEWRDRLRKFAHILPDMEVLMNGKRRATRCV